VICGDDDLQTFAEKGFNPGRDKPLRRREPCKGWLFSLKVCPLVPSDFNDMDTAAGIDAVRLVI